MTTSPDQYTELSFDQPVERTIVHREAVSEVYVTDAYALGDDAYLVGAQLPRRHFYYTDHHVSPDVPDHLLVLECCRQAATVVAHRWLGVPQDTSFLVTEWTSRLREPGTARAGRDHPGRLWMRITARDVVRRRGEVRSAVFDIELRLDDEPLGSGTVSAGYLGKQGYRSYRSLRRGSEPPLSGDMPPGRRGTPVPAALVNRCDPDNVVLVEGVWGASTAEARLDVPENHPVFYDHPLDHVPAMSLLEAASQAAVLAAGAELPRPQGYAHGLHAVFASFVELDEPTVVRARVEPTLGPGRRDRTVMVRFTQGDEEVCSVSVGVTPLEV
ncbi:ScbA/BarX family gamma-butyrolactone biosynthesis protein [Nocardiopsis sp. FIRDI 009]|uniref:ScbA/BarX family gamma-butyrolactone biosynthesis protein n=1 Tax=Nocardiopsis sp. FIRDI 009 TaxID=714197 RepID=UPI000E2494F2|nr:ScbA/BarX family gamma-butyrolactone biosynthesis protein [Nocardiopsis sp. FIRDI 009]